MLKETTNSEEGAAQHGRTDGRDTQDQHDASVSVKLRPDTRPESPLPDVHFSAAVLSSVTDTCTVHDDEERKSTELKLRCVRAKT